MLGSLVVGSINVVIPSPWSIEAEVGTGLRVVLANVSAAGFQV